MLTMDLTVERGLNGELPDVSLWWDLLCTHLIKESSNWLLVVAWGAVE